MHLYRLLSLLYVYVEIKYINKCIKKPYIAKSLSLLEKQIKTDMYIMITSDYRLDCFCDDLSYYTVFTMSFVKVT